MSDSYIYRRPDPTEPLLDVQFRLFQHGRAGKAKPRTKCVTLRGPGVLDLETVVRRVIEALNTANRPQQPEEAAA